MAYRMTGPPGLTSRKEGTAALAPLGEPQTLGNFEGPGSGKGFNLLSTGTRTPEIAALMYLFLHLCTSTGYTYTVAQVH